VELLEGEAAFSVVPDSAGRPFIVQAGSGEVRALGTRFVVRRENGSLQVTAIHHSIEVTNHHEAATQPPRVVLNPGQGVHIHRQQGLSPVEKIESRQVTAWEHGRLVFDRMPFTKVIEEVNRYRVQQILLTSPDLAHRRVSAVFHLDNLDHVVDMAADELGAEVARIPPFYTVLY